MAMYALVLNGCAASQAGPDIRVSKQSGSDVAAAATKVLDAFENKDGGQLGSLVHPDKGVRFSPSAYVDLEADRVLSHAEVGGLWRDPRRYVWGYADGSGDAIQMTPGEYMGRYVLARDFRQTGSISVNDDQAHGNTANNAAKVYPGASRVEYYVQATPHDPASAFDWAALRLVFEQVDGVWFLVGVIHDQWSP
jgi:hypothetical protein